MRARERDLLALQLRMRGLTFDAIADKMQLSGGSGTAYKAYQRAMASVKQENVKEHRAIEMERIDALWEPMFAKGLAGNHLAVDRCIALMDRRAKLLGLDEPIRIRQEIVTEAQLDSAIKELEAQNAELRAQQVAREEAIRLMDGDIVDADVVDESPGGEQPQLSPGQSVVPEEATTT